MSKYSSNSSHSTYMEYNRFHNLFYFKIYPLAAKTTGFGSRKAASLDFSINSNIAIYDIKNETTSYIFEKNIEGSILYFLFEEEYCEENKTILFNHQNGNIINNIKIEKREAINGLLMIVKNKKEHLEFWQSTKQGDRLKLIQTISEKTDWKLDVLNQKIIFIKYLDNAVKIEAIDWKNQ